MESAVMHWLSMLGEAGEVIDALKKTSLDQLMQSVEPQQHLVEEMADTMMFFVDAMACMDVTADAFAQTYQAKYERNMRRRKQ